MSIPRGSNIPHRLEVEIDLRNAVMLEITYQQNGKTVLKKHIDDCTISENEVIVEITQQESMRFREKIPTRIQLRPKFPDGTTFPSYPITVDTGELLDEELI